MYDLIIIGGGPAGLTASIYAIRKRLHALTISMNLGGKTNLHLSIPWAEHYQVIKGLEITEKFKTELEYLDFAHTTDTVTHVTQVNGAFSVKTKNGAIYDAKTILVATGVRMEMLGITGEKEFFFKGLSYSAISYSPLFIDKNTMVIGEGDLALRSVAELADSAASVQAVVAAADLESDLGKKLAAKKNITFYPGHTVSRILGDDYVKSVELETPAGETINLPVDGIFVEKSHLPNTEFLKGLVELDEQGKIKVDCQNRTNVPGIFAAGDVTSNNTEQVLVAVGEGAKAVLNAYDYLLRSH
ncbi:MAG: NAD(P)/FAD-dependent oxidoreductase [Anaerolineales bacterium]|nr:NAD(P)/FAD-dependent oxidoreductase [Anaerolineales bacterium]